MQRWGGAELLRLCCSLVRSPVFTSDLIWCLKRQSVVASVSLVDNLVEVVGCLLLLEYVARVDSCSAEVVCGSACCIDHVGGGEELFSGKWGGCVHSNVCSLFYLYMVA